MATVRDLRPATRPLQRIAERVVAHSVDILRVCPGLLIRTRSASASALDDPNGRIWQPASTRIQPPLL